MTWRFFNKLIFAVETSNEQELDDILKEEVGKCLELHATPTCNCYYIMNEMDNWFKSGDNVWLSAEKGRIFLKKTKEKMKPLRVTALSINCQNRLLNNQDSPTFNSEAISALFAQLKSFLLQLTRLVIVEYSNYARRDTFTDINGRQNYRRNQKRSNFHITGRTYFLAQ